MHHFYRGAFFVFSHFYITFEHIKITLNNYLI